MAQPMISQAEITKAAAELERMKGALRAWLKYRTLNDAVLAGQIPAGKSPELAQRAVAVARQQNAAVDARLAQQLSALLAATMPNARLPSPDAPGAAVALAKIALGEQPAALAGPFGLSTGGITALAIVAGVLLMVTTAIKSNADLAAEKERLACIQAGACTDSGFWLKWAAIVGVGWFAWTHLGLRDATKGVLKK